jgi:hypothetical protein
VGEWVRRAPVKYVIESHEWGAADGPLPHMHTEFVHAKGLAEPASATAVIRMIDAGDRFVYVDPSVGDVLIEPNPCPVCGGRVLPFEPTMRLSLMI